MRILHVLISLAWVVLVSSNGANLSPQELFNLNIDKRERIAIIGAGAGGSSAAYYLQRFSPGKYDITIFEKSDSVGGRSTTVDVKGHKVELGASVFVKANKILTNAVETFNLSTQKFGEKVKGTVAIWNGDRVVLELGSSWWSNIKLLIKYGLSPIRLVRLKNRFISKFLQSYYDGNFPFANLTDLTVESKFSEVTHLTAEEYLYEQEISDDFANNLIQAATRVNYAQNLDQIHGIGSLVAVAADGAEQVKDGNWIIFDNFIKYSDAKLHLQTRVKSIMKNEEGWLVSYDDKTSYFDQVIIASPFGQSRINLQSGSGKKLSEHPVEYVNLHVTLISTNCTISPSFIDSDSNESPKSILTTKDGQGNTPDFYSISAIDYFEDTDEYLYKIFSPRRIKAEFLEDVFTGCNGNISWIFRKKWRSYPYLKPNKNFGSFEIEQGLWYLNIIEPFISTMETSALAGANVAGLISHGKNTTEIKIP
ncbi:hypothetical protein HYPBUDRAFT_151805 [Hyphopichia burtonii NRRL Y-1933]|uniref:Prenylcysteine lyase domain-containing protein n=1 Tax=Hyphopichia burtonii NRRL Y-1933 TaxID=984485 RepID=A0A1E4RTC3_9ASCO|nr:hypothetical protein HYPBUDRAFT_151805 [Hyphopichia burtonii NRRL Y-1933]ODV70512.1 hypothetical protein HYPBUDRAFT_151805 [Hyphopichia burtonii NRRL Y-1933]